MTLKAPASSWLACRGEFSSIKDWASWLRARGEKVAVLQEELAKQQERLETAELAFSRKPTKTAAENKRVATNKIANITERLAQLDNSDLLAAEERILPGTYAPVMVWLDGRRDNLDAFWRGQFGHTHGVVVAAAFFENVPRHMAEGRPLHPGESPKSTVVAFRANPPEDLLLACLWSRWSAPGQPDLLSFALITDEPPQRSWQRGTTGASSPCVLRTWRLGSTQTPKTCWVRTGCSTTGNRRRTATPS